LLKITVVDSSLLKRGTNPLNIFNELLARQTSNVNSNVNDITVQSSSNGGGGGLSTSDKIALGVGLGIGIPTLIATIWGIR